MEAKDLVHRFLSNAGHDSETALSHLILLRDAIADAGPAPLDPRRRRCLHSVDDIIDTFRFYRTGERDVAEASEVLQQTLLLYAELTQSDATH